MRNPAATRLVAAMNGMITGSERGDLTLEGCLTLQVHGPLQLRRGRCSRVKLALVIASGIIATAPCGSPGTCIVRLTIELCAGPEASGLDVAVVVASSPAEQQHVHDVRVTEINVRKIALARSDIIGHVQACPEGGQASPAAEHAFLPEALIHSGSNMMVPQGRTCSPEAHASATNSTTTAKNVLQRVRVAMSGCAKGVYTAEDVRRGCELCVFSALCDFMQYRGVQAN